MRPERREPEADPVDHIIAWHDGDSRAAIETLMEDIQHLRMQLAPVTAFMKTTGVNIPAARNGAGSATAVARPRSRPGTSGSIIRTETRRTPCVINDIQ